MRAAIRAPTISLTPMLFWRPTRSFYEAYEVADVELCSFQARVERLTILGYKDVVD